MKKTLTVIAASALAAALVIFASGCSKSAGKSGSNDYSAAPKVQSSSSGSTQQSSKTQTSQSSQNSQSSQSSQVSQTGNQGGMSQAVVQTALDFFGGSTASGDSVTFVNTVTTSDGITYDYVFVYVGGASYPLYVSNDGSYAMEPADFNSIYNGDSGDGDDDYDGGGYDDDSVPYDDWDGGYGYDDDYQGPDHAEP